jgi:hypothetical protein
VLRLDAVEQLPVGVAEGGDALALELGGHRRQIDPGAGRLREDPLASERSASSARSTLPCSAMRRAALNEGGVPLGRPCGRVDSTVTRGVRSAKQPAKEAGCVNR